MSLIISSTSSSSSNAGGYQCNGCTAWSPSPFGSGGYCSRCAEKRAKTYAEMMYPMEGNDPKKWRKHEEQLENRIPALKNAPYACKRCGMKSNRPLDDPEGTWGRNGVCAYCLAR